MRLFVVGSVALDSSPGGELRDELGGSALYFSLAASRFHPVALSAPVGPDGEGAVRQLLRRHTAIDDSGLDVVNAPTYRWLVGSAHGRTVDLGSQDSIYDRWQPRLPTGGADWIFIGSMRPDVQLAVARQVAGCQLLAADAMLSYLHGDADVVGELIDLCHWFFCTREELDMLWSGDAEAFRIGRRLRGLVVKDGPDGAVLYTADGVRHQPALAARVVDTTGAGDSFAGGMLGYWLSHHGGPAALPLALAAGAEMAARTISAVGLKALAD
ncbi:MAG TPA: PfkB family carbohydrate kinase [Candidatus Nitrosotalea sp.]|nr:PfkB family carbohydrate kinase [Candidatus Nitrosotalea sp.]